MPDTTLITVRAAAVSAAVVFGIASATAPAYAGDPTPGTPVPSAEQTSGDHSHDHATTPPPPAESDHSDHAPPTAPTAPTEPTEPADRPRAWVFGGFAVVNGVALTYAAWLRRRTAPDRTRRNAARTAAQAREVGSR